MESLPLPTISFENYIDGTGNGFDLSVALAVFGLIPCISETSVVFQLVRFSVETIVHLALLPSTWSIFLLSTLGLTLIVDMMHFFKFGRHDDSWQILLNDCHYLQYSHLVLQDFPCLYPVYQLH